MPTPEPGVPFTSGGVDDMTQDVLDRQTADAAAEVTQSELDAVAATKGLPLGLTGATQATRYVGATASGAPAAGTFAVGDFIIDRTGKVYICTTAGTPGTWTLASGTSGSVATDTIWDAVGDLAVGSGADTAAKLAKGTALQRLRVNAAGNGLEWADVLPISQSLAAATTDTIATKVAGDANDRYVQDADGAAHYGPGSAAADLQTKRHASKQFGIGDEAFTTVLLVSLSTATEVRMQAANPGVAYRNFSFDAGQHLFQVSANDRFLITNTLITAYKGLKLSNGSAAGGSDVGGTVSFGTGAPVDATGTNGDIYFRVDGGALSTIYQRRAGVWVGIV